MIPWIPRPGPRAVAPKKEREPPKRGKGPPKRGLYRLSRCHPIFAAGSGARRGEAGERRPGGDRRRGGQRPLRRPARAAVSRAHAFVDAGVLACRGPRGPVWRGRTPNLNSSSLVNPKLPRGCAAARRRRASPAFSTPRRRWTRPSPLSARGLLLAIHVLRLGDQKKTPPQSAWRLFLELPALQQCLTASNTLQRRKTMSEPLE